MSKRFSKIYIEITNKCNLSCSFCSKDTLSKREMSVNEFSEVISKIKDYTNSIYLHVKGEPLLHSNLDKILSTCDDNNIKVNITTNGTLLDKKKDILLKHSIKQINVSLHSENNIDDYFAKVFNTCDLLSKKTTIIYRIWTLKTLDLDKTSMDIVNYLKNHYSLDEDKICQIKKEKNIKICRNIYLDKDYEFDWPKISDNKCDYGTCLGGKNHIAILSNGIVTICCLDSNGIINLGNIFESDLKSILSNSLYKEIINGFQNKKIVSNLCMSCTYRKRFDK